MKEVASRLVEPDPDADGKRRIRPDLWPDPAFVDVGIRGDASELADVPTLEPLEYSGETRTGRFVDSVAGVMHHRMEQDDRIVVLGEDVHRLNGGTNGATKNLAKDFPGRVLGTPISENAFVGLGGGMALDGRFRPVVEFMYPDFLWVAADQVFNQIGKARHMFGGDNPVPLVLRTKVAMGSGYGSQHLMDPAGVFATSVGWRIVAPSTAADYIGLMNTALDLQDPVLVIEHIDLYPLTEETPVDLDYRLPLGKAAVRRVGSDVTVISYLSMVRHSLEAVEQTGVDAEVIDLRWLDRASLDWDTIGESIRKTNAVLIVEQGAQGTSYGGWLSDEIQRRFFDWLDQPVQRVTGSEASPSISKVLERAAIAQDRGGRRRARARRGRDGGALMASIVRMPEVLANVTEAAIANWLVQKGQEVAVGAPLAEVETEKAVVEYAAEIGGTVLELLVAEGASVAVGEPIAVIGAPGETADADAGRHSASQPSRRRRRSRRPRPSRRPRRRRPRHPRQGPRRRCRPRQAARPTRRDGLRAAGSPAPSSGDWRRSGASTWPPSAAPVPTVASCAATSTALPAPAAPSRSRAPAAPVAPAAADGSRSPPPAPITTRSRSRACAGRSLDGSPRARRPSRTSTSSRTRGWTRCSPCGRS